ncbi:MAG: hypothetical protein LBU39_08485 [Desulfobulbaceae bacterium]|jgi:hypothetical protein|nr:hypothetical protein [Desulfobulbaceae bacterium]
MKLVCPACGATASADAWHQDAACREMMAQAFDLDKEIQRVLLSYLSLFRPEKSSLSWARALRLVTELRALTAKGYAHVQGKADRRCPPHLWAAAMEQMVLRRAQLSLPVKNHNYLRQVAWQLADQADALADRQGRQAEAAHRPPPTGCCQEIHPADDPAVRAKAEKAIAEIRARLGNRLSMSGDRA